ncbi:histidine kinase [Corynebacterium oculi]|uniref:Sensor histidine kinase DesK n=1 Tax=Corynebacterium oculi TaxID=1544416 RepID=A0A0Q1DTD8_9CORY|nr:histidine kinase [Corynebacterium oculi]KQB83325.1 Sensor histidine kinase DesK [Corynebacterium oculi]
MVRLPVRTWRSLPASGKFASFMRLSCLVYPLLPLSLVALWEHEGASWLPIFLWTGLCTLLSAAFFLRSPQLAADNTRYHRTIFTVGFALTLCSLLAAVVGSLFVSPLDATAVILAFAIILAYGYLPFLKRPWIYTGLLALLEALPWLVGPAPAIHDAPLVPIGLYSTFLFFGCGTTLSIIWSIRLMEEAEHAAELQRHLILAEERLRFSQEIHDTLGQRLAAISIKAELAQALARANDPRLRAEITEIQQITRTAASEVRSVIHGHSDIDMDTEIHAARALLHTAGIPLHTTGNTSDIPAAHRELSAWFVREATTNILKHSRATAASLSLQSTGITMRNDGAAHSEPPRFSGLEKLRRRAAMKNGALLHTHSHKGEFQVKLSFNPEEQ